MSPMARKITALVQETASAGVKLLASAAVCHAGTHTRSRSHARTQTHAPAITNKHDDQTTSHSTHPPPHFRQLVLAQRGQRKVFASYALTRPSFVSGDVARAWAWARQRARCEVHFSRQYRAVGLPRVLLSTKTSQCWAGEGRGGGRREEGVLPCVCSIAEVRVTAGTC